MSEENQIKTEVYRFGDCELDADRRELRVAGEPVTTQPKAFELLLYLVRNRHRAVDKDELQDELWPRSIVTETALTRCIMKARRAVNDDATQQSVIKTIHGHGYRFVADIEDAASASVPEPAPVVSAARVERNTQLRLGIVGVALAITIALAFLYLTPNAFSGPVRLAVLPVDNATANDELDWVRTGLMVLISRMLEERGVNVVSDNSVTKLAGDQPLHVLMNPDGEFQRSLTLTTSATHSIGARLDHEQGVYRLTYTLSGSDDKPQTRTVVGEKPAVLAKEAVEIIATLVTRGAPELERMEFVSTDDFLNEAYARAMSLQFEGRFEEAQHLFRVILEQQPGLWWPRYEYALSARYLRDFDTSERMFVELRDEATGAGFDDRAAAVNNGLGVLYMNRLRNDEAREAFEATLAHATAAGKPRYEAVAHQNLGLLAKNLGDLETSRQHMQTATTIYDQADIGATPGTLHNNYSGLLLQLGRIEEAEKHSLAAVENFRLTNQRLFESYALSRLATVYRRQGLLDDAETVQMRAMSVREELDDRKGIGSSLISLSSIAFDRGDLTRSIQFGQQAADLATEIDEPELVVAAKFRIAKAQLYLENYDKAATIYEEIEPLSRMSGDTLDLFAARHGLAKTRIESGRLDEGEAIANELLEQTRERDQQRLETGAMFLLSDIHRARAEWQQAVDLLQQVREITLDIGDTQSQVHADRDLADCYIALGDLDAARPHVDAVVAARPDDAEVMRVQARFAASSGDAIEAVRVMRLARTSAGEGWRSADIAMLEEYERAAAAIDGD